MIVFLLLVVVSQEEPVEPVVEGDEDERVVNVACHAHVLHIVGSENSTFSSSLLVLVLCLYSSFSQYSSLKILTF